MRQFKGHSLTGRTDVCRSGEFIFGHPFSGMGSVEVLPTPGKPARLASQTFLQCYEKSFPEVPSVFRWREKKFD